MLKNHDELKTMLKQGGCWFLALMPYLPIPEGVTTREQYRHLTSRKPIRLPISVDRLLHLIALLLLAGLYAKGQTPTARATAEAPSYTEKAMVPLSVDLTGALRVASGSSPGGGLTDAQLRATPVPVSGTFFQATQPVSGTFWQAIQPVSGTVSVSGSVAVTGTFWQATQPVSIAGTVSDNIAQIGATTVVNGGLAGTLAIGGTAATNAAINQNPLLIGAEALSTQPAAASTGNQRRLVSTLDGALYTRSGGPVTWTCGLQAIAASLTQCQAAPGAGLSLYITSIAVQTTTATSGTYSFQQGTGTNCGTGTAAVFPVSGTANRFNAPTTANAMANIQFPVPLKLTANAALCMIGVATNTISAQVVGFTAP